MRLPPKCLGDARSRHAPSPGRGSVPGRQRHRPPASEGPKAPGRPAGQGCRPPGGGGGEGRPRTLTLVVLQQPVRAHVPHLHRAVRAAGGDARAAGVEVHAGDEAGKTGAATRTGRARRLGADPRTPSTVPQPRTPPSRLPPARCPQQVARGEGAEGESSGCSDAGGCTRGQSQAPTLSTRRESGLWTTRQPAARGFERQSWGPSTRAGLPGRNRGGLSGGALTGLTEEGEAGLHPGTQDR